MGEEFIKLPAVWLSHGYQAAIAWLADVVGQILWEASAAGLDIENIAPKDMEGLVLVDELDLHLHPSWQRGLVPALKQTFPRLQFVVTTHSPMLLAGLRPDEVVVLDVDERGNVTPTTRPDPRLMTSSEIYERYFGIAHAHPDDLGRRWREYRYLADDPHRTADEDRRVQDHLRYFADAGFDPGSRPVERSES